MSEGRFDRAAGYETEGGDTRPIRVQPETITAWNPEAVGTVSGSYVKVSGSRRGYGTFARVARFEWNGTPPTGYDDRGTITLPILTPAAYNALNVGSNYAYLGASLTLIGLSPERSR